MRDFLETSLGIILSFALFSLLSHISIFSIQVINVFSLLVIYMSSTRNEVYGACLGAVCGLIQDSFSLGVFGVAGIAKTIMGYLAGFVSKRIDVSSFWRSFLFIFVLITIELMFWAFLYSFIYSKALNTGKGVIFLQPLIMALIGSTLFPQIRKAIKAISRYRR
ncbi:MAG: rod shape-determining protein MreD [Candidatus Aminicenantaceae bacterium]|jgi:rod shape-determining protein MreD